MAKCSSPACPCGRFTPRGIAAETAWSLAQNSVESGARQRGEFRRGIWLPERIYGHRNRYIRPDR